ncbi:MAG: orotidine-5'-phosphate decarboxylase, partial [Bdellovibrionales bacterium]|nr:orotidine-5'-phosphate decarboxylase [Bdellovibrionales bacterium]
DRLSKRIDEVKAPLCVGFDPRPEWIPECFLEEAQKIAESDDDFVCSALFEYLRTALEAVSPFAAAIKPNLAFFEMLGIGGLRAFSALTFEARNLGLPVIADAKRGDIGSTAEAYASAFFGSAAFGQKTISLAHVDALTINPFLGFDTLEPFVTACEEHDTGIFVLVKTSNPGSGDLQNCRVEQSTISERVALWLHQQANRLGGKSGLSGLGAVVGATYPEEAQALREVMPKNYFLIPGMGAQGGSAEEAAAGFTNDKRGAIVNVSRGILGQPSSKQIFREEFRAEVSQKAEEFHRQLQDALNVGF